LSVSALIRFWGGSFVAIVAIRGVVEG